ncbi:MAG: DUF4239 domain-containing protein [Mycobacteriales bacterium]
MGIVIVLAAAVATAVVAILLGRRRAAGESGGGVDFVNAALAAVYLVLLAFNVVVCWERIDGLNGDIRTEAGDVRALAGLTGDLPAPVGDQVRADATDYAHAVLDREWPATGEPLNAAAAIPIVKARQALATVPGEDTPAAKARDQASDVLDDLTETRQDRITSSAHGLPWILNAVLALLTVVQLVTPLALGLRRGLVGALLAGVNTAVVVAGLLFVLDLNTPYSGVQAVDRTPLHAAARSVAGGTS